jgi:hypothetical protein
VLWMQRNKDARFIFQEPTSQGIKGAMHRLRSTKLGG